MSTHVIETRTLVNNTIVESRTLGQSLRRVSQCRGAPRPSDKRPLHTSRVYPEIGRGRSLGDRVVSFPIFQRSKRKWWLWEGSNLRPFPYEETALPLSYTARMGPSGPIALGKFPPDLPFVGKGRFGSGGWNRTTTCLPTSGYEPEKPPRLRVPAQDLFSSSCAGSQ